jgi:hypothetical protein
MRASKKTCDELAVGVDRGGGGAGLAAVWFWFQCRHIRSVGSGSPYNRQQGTVPGDLRHRQQVWER